MLVKYHVIVGLIVSLLIWFLFPQIGWFYALIMFLASFLIDFDHYLWYGFTKNDWSLNHAFKFFHEKREWFHELDLRERKEYKNMLLLFHGIECWIIILLLTFIHEIFLFVLGGIAIHMVLDFMDLYQNKYPLHIKISQIYNHHKNKTKKKLI